MANNPLLNYFQGQSAPVGENNLLTMASVLQGRSAPPGGYLRLAQAQGGTPSMGLLTPGNIDLYSRPTVRNPDGSISTVRSMSVNFGNGEVLIPTVSDDGRLLGDDDAIDLYKKTGRHLGIFDTPENATSYAKRLHDDQDAYYNRR